MVRKAPGPARTFGGPSRHHFASRCGFQADLAASPAASWHNENERRPCASPLLQIPFLTVHKL